MIVEFLVACSLTPAAVVKQAIIDLLGSVLRDNGNDFEERVVVEMVTLKHLRAGDTVGGDDVSVPQRTIIGFALELPEETGSPDRVVDEFAKGMADLEDGFHVLRFEDPMLQAQLAEYSDQIFQLEMKLRRVLSIIYLHAYPIRDPYDLLRTANIRIHGSPTPTVGQMKLATENQFFHILFSDYIRVNDRRPTSIEDIQKLIQESAQYEEFHDEVVRTSRNMIYDQKDVDLIGEIRRNLQPIEDMRNCVAHNRRPITDIVDKYNQARPALESKLDFYLAEWQIEEEI